MADDDTTDVVGIGSNNQATEPLPNMPEDVLIDSDNDQVVSHDHSIDEQQTQMNLAGGDRIALLAFAKAAQAGLLEQFRQSRPVVEPSRADEEVTTTYDEPDDPLDDFESMIERMQADNAKNDRLRKEQADHHRDLAYTAEGELEDSLFVGNDDTAADMQFLHSDDEDHSTTQRSASKKRAATFEHVDDDTGLQSASPAKKRKRTAQRDDLHEIMNEYGIMPTRKKRGRPKGKGKVSEEKTPKQKRARPAKKKKDPRENNISYNRLVSSNVIGDAAATAGLRGPVVAKKARNRKEALASLLASIPKADRAAARDDQQAVEAACQDLEGRSVTSTGEGWLIKGMKSPLMNFQLIAVAFMRRRERSVKQPRGGILADAMGLGKTVQTLANIVNGKGLSREGRTATLIVLPAALVEQWTAEIHKHVELSMPGQRTNHGLSTIISYSNACKAYDEAQLSAALANADIVLATYSAVLKSCPRMDPPANLTTATAKDEWYRDDFKKNAGVLHRIKWYRVVLDEASQIKNHKSFTSIACRALNAEVRWAISGTPVQNTTTEFYPYFRFIREPCIRSFRQFSSNFCDPEDPDARGKLLALLSKVMIQRTHKDTFMGGKLLDLPEPEDASTIEVTLNPVERKLYSIIKQKYVARINTMAQDGGLTTKYRHVFTLMLRLRQSTSHPLLLQTTFLELLDRADLERLNDICLKPDGTAERVDGRATMMQLQDMLETAGEARQTANRREVVYTQGAPYVAEDDDAGSADDASLGSGHGMLGNNFKKYIETLNHGEAYQQIKERTRCAACKEEPEDAQITSCDHIYCRACLESLSERAAHSGRAKAKCVACGTEWTSARQCHEPEQNHDENAMQQTQPTLPASSGKRGHSKLNQWIKMKGAVAPSAKTMAMKVQVLKWLKQDPHVKIIVYSQWIPLLHILEKVCNGEGWTRRMYTGDQTQTARNRALAEFIDDNYGVNILLASLKCGSYGLNLTAASRVLIMDSWWNDSVEQQAFCRVFRHGQNKKTSLTRLVVNDSIDEDMMKIKERKLLQINPIMEDDDRHNKPTLQELLRMFGRVGEVDGHEFIFPEDDDGDDERFHLIDDDSQDEFNAMGNEA